MSAAASGGGGVQDYSTLSIRELKSILTERGVDHANCVEKSDLIELCGQNINDDERELIDSTAQGVHFDIEQNTPQWFHIRRGNYDVRIGGSEIGVVVGVSPWAETYSLLDKIIQQTNGTWDNSSEEETPPPCAHGHTCEPLIADMFAFYLKKVLTDGGYYRHPHPKLGEFYGASPDRRIMGKNGLPKALLEIKAPYGRMYKTVKPEYMAQIQYQMWCAGLSVCYFLAIKLDHDTPEKTIPSKTQVYLARVHRSSDYIKWMLPRLFLFSTHLTKQTPLPPGLYKSEASGFEAPPNPIVEEIPVETGAWRIQKEA